MGVHFPTAGSKTILNGVLPQNTELAVVTTPPLNLILDGAQILLHWFVQFLNGTGTTAVTYRVRQGSGITGTTVQGGFATIAAASSSFQWAGCTFDTPGIVAGMQYTLTLLTTGATGNGTVNEAALLAYVL